MRIFLVSGGIDSTVTMALCGAGPQDTAIYIDYGQRQIAERECAKWQADRYGVPFKEITLRGVIDKPVGETGTTLAPAYVPARNTLFLSIALGYAESLSATEIVCGPNKDDYAGFPDCRPTYFAEFERLAYLATGRVVSVKTPLIQFPKQEIVKLGHSLGVDFSHTLSCYFPDKNSQHCGVCGACTLRASAMVSATGGGN